MAQYIQYLSTDASAPVLNGISGSMINVLDGCLVNGYGSKPGAGWSKVLSSGSYWAVYGMPSGSSGHYLRVIDRYHQWTGFRGFETMSSVLTGSNPFPLDAQIATPAQQLGVRTSNTTGSSISRPWRLYADSRSFVLFTEPGDVGGIYSPLYFGEIYSFKPGDKYNTAIIGHESVLSSTQTITDFGTLVSQIDGNAVAGHFIVRSYTGITGSVELNKVGNYSFQGDDYLFFAGNVPFPNGPDGGIYMCPLVVSEASSVTPRGILRGVYMSLHAEGLIPDETTFSGSGDYTGKIFTTVYSVRGGTSTYDGTIFMELSDTLPTN